MRTLNFQVFLSSESDTQRSINDFEPVMYFYGKYDCRPMQLFPVGATFHDYGIWWTIRYISGNDLYLYIMITADGDPSLILGPLIDQHGFQISESTVRKFAKTFPILTRFILSKIKRSEQVIEGFEPRSPMDTPEEY